MYSKHNHDKKSCNLHSFKGIVFKISMKVTPEQSTLSAYWCLSSIVCLMQSVKGENCDTKLACECVLAGSMCNILATTSTTRMCLGVAHNNTKGG